MRGRSAMIGCSSPRGEPGQSDGLERGMRRLARHEIIVFADARQSWAPDALARLLANFADPDVGAVSGELIVESVPGVMAGVGLYWQFEKWLRQQESAVSSSVGVTGAISAVRRTLFRPIPPGTILDDLVLAAWRGDAGLSRGP